MAHALAAKRIPVFPCVPNGKRPLTQHGLYDASTDPTVIARWARQWPGANLAIPTGHRTGVCVVDVDRKDGRDGAATLHELERNFGELPVTLTARTPSGGAHFFFRMPTAEVRNTCGKIAGAAAPGIDVRGNGGYVLICPSTIEGRAYAWIAQMPPTELPTRWVNALARQELNEPPPSQRRFRSAQEYYRSSSWCLRALQDEARGVAAAPPGTRNDQLWRAAAALGGLVHLGVIDVQDVREALAWACSTWGARRSPRKDAHTIENGLAFGLAHPRHVEIGDARAAR